jgi:hypothetical protein
MSPQSLDQFISPLVAQQFLREIYGTRPSHIPGEPGRFSDLLPWDVLNDILFQHQPDDPRFKLAKDGKVIRLDSYVTNYPSLENRGKFGGHRSLNIINLIQALREGATLIIDRIDQMHAPIAALCRTLERDLCDLVDAGVYAAWRASKGFDTHWDDCDVFVVQVLGRKNWRIFRPSRRFPTTKDGALSLSPPEDLFWAGELSSGDLLYIPRGWWHDAVALDEPTLHLTLGIRRAIGLDFLNYLFSQLRDYEIARADLPRFASLEEQKQYILILRDIVANLLSEDSMRTYFHKIDSSVPGRMRLSLPWSVMPNCQPISKSAWVHWLPVRRTPLMETADKVVLNALGATFTFKKDVSPLIRCLVERSPVRVEELNWTNPEMAVEAVLSQLLWMGLISLSSGIDPRGSNITPA